MIKVELEWTNGHNASWALLPFGEVWIHCQTHDDKWQLEVYDEVLDDRLDTREQAKKVAKKVINRKFNEWVEEHQEK